jgi:hypothetical protein
MEKPEKKFFFETKMNVRDEKKNTHTHTHIKGNGNDTSAGYKHVMRTLDVGAAG